MLTSQLLLSDEQSPERDDLTRHNGKMQFVNYKLQRWSQIVSPIAVHFLLQLWQQSRHWSRR